MSFGVSNKKSFILEVKKIKIMAKRNGYPFFTLYLFLICMKISHGHIIYLTNLVIIVQSKFFFFFCPVKVVNSLSFGLCYEDYA